MSVDAIRTNAMIQRWNEAKLQIFHADICHHNGASRVVYVILYLKCKIVLNIFSSQSRLTSGLRHLLNSAIFDMSTTNKS